MSRLKADPTLSYPMYNDHILYLVNGWWDFCDIILKGLLNKNNPP
jgi:hypothetical protein